MITVTKGNKKGDDDLRDWLIEKRKKKFGSQNELAKAIHMSRPLITTIESGERTPSVETAKKIAHALDFDWTIFFEQDSYKTQQGDIKQKA